VRPDDHGCFSTFVRDDGDDVALSQFPAGHWTKHFGSEGAQGRLFVLAAKQQDDTLTWRKHWHASDGDPATVTQRLTSGHAQDCMDFSIDRRADLLLCPSAAPES
jgi:hypothetical protein